jgi:predicted lipoprotein
MRARVSAAAVALLGFAAASACRVATVRRLDETSHAAPGPAAEKPFAAAALVDSAWDAQVLPALASGRDAALLAGGDAALAAPVVVRGRGRMLEVDSRSRTGVARVELEGGQAVVLLQVGPVLAGTAIRDALPAFSFEHFANQIQHADVGNELNARVEERVLKSLDHGRLRGRQVSFAGMASREAGRPLLVTPVRLEVLESR